VRCVPDAKPPANELRVRTAARAPPDCVLPDLGAPSRRDLEAAMKRHVLGTATLMGIYAKGGR
jgi:phosphatidylethanolamine-binding protein (PEBP) family uncharacterized protein